MTVNILGTDYEIVRTTYKEDDGLTDCDGYCDDSVKRIVVSCEENNAHDAKADIPAVRRKQLRHEIVHAFLCESGLAENSDWAQNEEIVDWFAIQGLKIYKAWGEAGAV